nr:Spy/CpxP family protein refolding chaperone [uncultured Rhodopila sp.]
MSCFAVSPFMSAPVKRSLAVAGLIAAAVLAAPPAFAQAAAPDPAHQTRTERRAETVEQRIAALHAGLKITPAEEPAWQAVAQTMRDNAAALDKLAGETAGQSRKGMTALEDMQTYARYAQAHADGAKALIASFAALYDMMPDEQKKLADRLFQSNRRRQGAVGG